LPLLGALALLVLLFASAAAQPKKDGPRILVAVPPGVRPGVPTRLLLRGRRLDGATAVRCLGGGTVKVLKKSKVGVPPQQNARAVGDTQLEVELTVPADAPAAALTLVAVTPGGDSPPHRVLLDRVPVVAEKEPNDGFKQAQPLTLGQTVQGSVSRPQDVDLYRFEGRAGQAVVLEVFAARLGSPLDSILTLYDGRGEVLSSSDDLADSTDSRLEVVLPRTGTYFAAVMDAHDQGGPTFVYRLAVAALPAGKVK
jgi:hypothetical protein